MQLKTGFYFISTIVTSPWGERWVQRDSVEDKSFVPKPVNIQVDEAGAAEVPNLPAKAHTHTSKSHADPETPSQWYVEQFGDSKVFKLSAGSINADPAPTVDQDGKLVADISGSSETNWTVTECGETCDEGVFIITDDEGNAWQTPQTNDTDPQILLEYLVIPLIYPPKYPTYAQFKFASVDDVD